MPAIEEKRCMLDAVQRTTRQGAKAISTKGEEAKT